MKKLLFIALIAITYNSTSLRAQVYESKWQNSQIVIDGNSADWEGLPGYFNGDTRILYETRNDADNLYVIIEIPDQQMQVKAMHGGLKISFTVKTKPKIKAQIVFPILAQEEESFRQSPKLDFESTKQNFLLMKDFAAIEGFIQSKGHIAPSNADQKKLSFASGWDDKNVLCYEVRIPFNDLFAENYTIQDRIKTEIGMGITLLAMPIPTKGIDDYSSDDGMEQQSGQVPYENKMSSPSGNMNNGTNHSEMGVMFNEVGFRFTIKPSEKGKKKE